MKKPKDRLVSRAAAGVLVVLAAALLIIIWIAIPAKGIRWLSVGLVSGLFLVLGLYAAYLRSRVAAFGEELCDSLDQLIAGNPPSGYRPYEDSLIAKTQGKLFQYYDIMSDLIDTIVGLVLLLIAVLNYVNTLIAGALDRKKEFAVYESLGMTNRQLERLVVTEGILHALLLSLIVLPVTALAVWIWGKWWLAGINTWCIIYHFSLLPLWITLPVLIILSVLIPLTVLRLLHHESITERLSITE